nr:SLC13 family permease [Pannonibacter sp. XCT-34]
MDRVRIETVALAGLAAGCLAGLVPLATVFSGLSHPAVITVVAVLLIVHALNASNVMDAIARRLVRVRLTRTVLLALVCGLGAVLSSVMNNIGALALMLPVVFSLSRALGLDPRGLLMPLSFATLLGGLCTLIGTPANLIVSQAREEATGQGFALLDFLPSGLLATLAGCAVLVLWVPRLFPLRSAETQAAAQSGLVEVCELHVLSPVATCAALEELLDGRVISIRRQDRFVFPLRGDTALAEPDAVFAEAPAARVADALQRGLVRRVSGQQGPSTSLARAAVMPHSVVVGSRIAAIADLDEAGIEVLSVTTQGRRQEGGIGDVQLIVGDVLLLRGPQAQLQRVIEDNGLLAVSAPPEPSGPVSLLPFAVFAAGLALMAVGLLPPEAALGLVVVALVLTGHLDLRAALRDLNWPIILVIVAMLPLGAALEATGTARLIADTLASGITPGNVLTAAGVMLLISVFITPLVNNVSTAVVLSPVALELAGRLGVEPGALLMAVAVGASLDFLTPIGHHNNTLAYGLGNYRFVDFLKAGAPVTLAAAPAALLGIWLAWGSS